MDILSRTHSKNKFKINKQTKKSIHVARRGGRGRTLLSEGSPDHAVFSRDAHVGETQLRHSRTQMRCDMLTKYGIGCTPFSLE